MQKKIFFFILYLFLQISFQAQDKTIYFDSNWKETTLKNAAFYRPMPLLKVGKIELLRDYYFKTKTLQMQGYFADGIEKNYVGELYWYEEDGTSSSQSNYINISKQKNLSYYFEDGTIWKTTAYGDSLKNGKTIEYKIDGSVLGESIYKDEHLVSGVSGDRQRENLRSYNIKTKNDEYVSMPYYSGPEINYMITYYWVSTLKTAVEYIYKGDHIITEKNYDRNGNLLQKLDSTSYFNNDETVNNPILKNGKDYSYITSNSGVNKEPTFVDYKSYPFTNVVLDHVEYAVLYRGTVHFLQKKSAKDFYDLVDYQYLKEGEKSFVSIRSYRRSEDEGDPLEKFKDKEAVIISVSDIPTLTKQQIYERFSKKTWRSTSFQDKDSSEKLHFVSAEFLGSTLFTPNKTRKNDRASAVIYINIAPDKYILLLESGGYLIPTQSGDLLEIPNFKLK